MAGKGWERYPCPVTSRPRWPHLPSRTLAHHSLILRAGECLRILNPGRGSCERQPHPLRRKGGGRQRGTHFRREKHEGPL